MKSQKDDNDYLPLPAFITRVRSPDESVTLRPFSERHPILALPVILLIIIPLLLIIVISWIFLYIILRPIDLIIAWIMGRPINSMQLISKVRDCMSGLVQLLV